MFSRTVAGLNSGMIGIEFRPSFKYLAGGSFFLRLNENPSNYYEIYNTDGLGAGAIKKVINGQEVELSAFENEYSQNVNYHILVNFSPGYTKIVAFGDVFTFETDNSSIVVNNFEIELIDQDAYFDNIRYAEVLSDCYVAIGNSITKGSHDDIATDGIGFEPILANHLLQLKEYSHTVINEGVSGNDSSEGLALLPTILGMYPQARFYLIQYGTNDAWAPRPSGLGLQPADSGYPGSFKDNMQQIITLIKNAGRVPYLAKVPIALGDFGYLNTAIQEYNEVIDELVADNNIGIVPPDFYYFFENNPDQIDDGIHPNGVGYQSMAIIWRDALTNQ